MALKFYFTKTTNATVPTNWHGTWNANGSAVNMKLLTAPETATPTSVAPTENQNSADYNVAMGRWISDALPVGTTFTNNSTTWQSVIGVGENNAAASHFDRFYIWIWTGSGVGDSSAANLSTDANSATEWTTTIAGRQMLNSTAVAITTIGGAGTYTTVAGDRLVVEMGYHSTSTDTVTYTGTMYYGGDGADLDVNGDETTLSAWISFTGVPSVSPSVSPSAS
ncbi:MAG: hypothetical protein Q7T74_02335, partial [Candidatus Saccharibacteria bacterium]|nr:hypothetical protein [Candidatus Saccharibacteria bacterium]